MIAAKKLKKPIVTLDDFNNKITQLMSVHTLNKVSKKKNIKEGKTFLIKVKKSSIQDIFADNIDKNGKIRKSKSIKSGKCVPFLYKNKLVDEKCVEGKEGNWCATTVDKNNKMLTWGYC